MSTTIKHFFASWGSDSQSQKQIVENLVQNRSGIALENIDVGKNQEDANKYQIRSVPTIVIEKNGGVVERFVGLTQAREISSALQNIDASASNSSTGDTNVYLREKDRATREGQDNTRVYDPD